jgi:peptide/nickel transport system substrate-binding protein
MRQRARTLAAGVLAAALCAAGPVLAAPEGQVTLATHFTLAPTFFDPAETPGIITPFMILYALHDALVKPMPGKVMAPSLAESWTVSSDGLVYEFVLRKGARFHTGEPVTAEDVKFSFERYRGIFSRTLKEHVGGIETPDPAHVRFRLKKPWPDFMLHYGTPATGAGWIVPKKYVEKVGDDGFKKAPVGAGPYRFVSSTPGVELVVEAFDGYWRKTPAVKRLVFKGVPDGSTRLAMLKRGDTDIAFGFDGTLADEVRRTPGLTLRAAPFTSTHWLNFVDQWDPKSPWHDRRVRLAANLAVNHQAINQAETLGFSRLTNSIIPSSFDFYWQPPPPVHDPARARQLLAEAGYPGGFDAGDFWCDAGTSTTAASEALLNDLGAVGIKSRLRPLERAAFLKANQDKKLRNIVYNLSGTAGSAATRIEAFVVGGGLYAYGSYPDIDGLYREQVNELDPRKREATLRRVQQLMHDKAMFLPVWQFVLLQGVGPRVAEPAISLITDYPWTAPFEDMKLK